MTGLSAPVRPSAIARVNPVAKLAVAVLISVALLLSIDVVSASVALALVGILLFWSGLDARGFWLRTAPLWLGAPFAGLTTVLYGKDSGDVVASLGFATVSEGSLTLGIAITLRVLAIGLPSIVLFATTDPTDLADGLAQVLRLPSRFVLGGLAGLRMVGLFVDDWRALGQARRARGVGDAHVFVRFTSQAFGLLVLAIRRGSKLATAMEAKGFGSHARRTWARPSTVGRPEAVLLLIGAGIACASIAAAVLAGTWTFILA
ncbi:energy-coupling factor transport system permease protein [Okibacterium sp. HSC-33S16]|jgi:energy-coupling factor transport system permease protein|uniref:energy-coupling factor transporter transmembrane component T family protein n=1 Tax=Okibacterium sp. HSC-33S16 TaxID=2910965 RepID=UPI0020A13ACD|nr:energy-coupling factor transporter transmembrane component T [Okibacterium sp. HSC-33S16]MCP2030605.1 energy-coupling factor transport system permease protein [Okibacterium sp. HSC-33S16]